MKTYENNMADQALTVKRLKVLESIDGGPVREIKQTVEAVRQQTNVISRQQDEYWKTLSDDGIITPIEKQSLLRESKNIDRSFAAITQQAATLGIASAILEDYIATYNALRTYLFTTLKLFDDMQSETQIDDRDTFNAYFSGYYFSENFVLLAITAGILDTIDFRVLQSLTEPGEEGETAIYHGALYQYVNGQWKNVTTGAYKGPRTELPPDEEEAFFIVSESFTMSESLIVNDEELLVNDEVLLVSHTYLKGYIYYFQAGTWHPEWDKTNWRYAAAFADVLNITGELPQIFQDGLDAIQANLDAAVLILEDEIAAKQGQYTIIGGEMVLIDDLLPDIVDEYNQQQTEIDSKVSHLPEYFGGTSVAPGSPQEGDFYLFTGSGENNCKVRRYHNAAWEWLDPTNTNYRNYYMMALQDILSNTNAGTATFSNAFAGSFWTAWANMTTLEVKTIYLRNGGTIQSDNLTYVPETRGTKLDYYGNFDANGDTHLGGKVAIGVPLTGNTDFNDYDVVIGGNTKISGELDGATGSFSGTVRAFAGRFEAGLGEIFRIYDFYDGLTQERNSLYIGPDNLDNCISGILLIRLGTQYREHGSYPILWKERIYDDYILAYYNYKNSVSLPGWEEPDYSELKIDVITGTAKEDIRRYLSVEDDPEDSQKKVLRLNNYAFTTSPTEIFYRHCELINIKIITAGNQL